MAWRILTGAFPSLLALAVVCASWTSSTYSMTINERDKSSIRIVIVGDTSFGEPYHDRLASQGREPVLRTQGYPYMLGEFANLLQSTDYVVANLETAVTDKFPSPFAGVKQYIHYADIHETPRHLADHGVKLVSLANNHSFDFGAAGLDQTLERLADQEIDHCGAGLNDNEAERPFIKPLNIEEKSINIAFLCSHEYRESYDANYDYYATSTNPGTARLDTGKISQIVSKLKQQHKNLFIICYPHWGSNYKWRSKRQRALAHFMVENGVDLVLGHGAHMLQEIETHQQRWILYSLGNFVFGSPGRYGRDGAVPYGLIAVLELFPTADGIGKKLRLYPIFTNNRKTKYRPRFVTETEFKEVYALLTNKSGIGEKFENIAPSGMDDHGYFLEIKL